MNQQQWAAAADGHIKHRAVARFNIAHAGSAFCSRYETKDKGQRTKDNIALFSVCSP
jgi:hypothetical protein